jgi:hypothetical protein
VWDHRFVLFQSKNEFRLIQYICKGSQNTKLKCTISDSQAQEIIEKLNLVNSKDFFLSNSTWRKDGFSELDMQRKLSKKCKKMI